MLGKGYHEATGGRAGRGGRSEGSSLAAATAGCRRLSKGTMSLGGLLEALDRLHATLAELDGLLSSWNVMTSDERLWGTLATCCRRGCVNPWSCTTGGEGGVQQQHCCDN